MGLSDPAFPRGLSEGPSSLPTPNVCSIAPVLPRWSHAPIRSLARALFDRGSGIPADRLEWMIQDLGDFMAGAGPKTRTAFLLNILVLDLLAPVLRRKLGRLRSLPPEDTVALLEQLDESNLAILLPLPKAMLALIYYEHPEAIRETGYDALPLITGGRS